MRTTRRTARSGPRIPRPERLRGAGSRRSRDAGDDAKADRRHRDQRVDRRVRLCAQASERGRQQARSDAVEEHSPAKLSYGGRKLAKGSRKIKSGANLLTVKPPRKHGNYRLLLKAVGADGQSAQTTVALHDAAAKGSKRGHH